MDSHLLVRAEACFTIRFQSSSKLCTIPNLYATTYYRKNGIEGTGWQISKQSQERFL